MIEIAAAAAAGALAGPLLVLEVDARRGRWSRRIGRLLDEIARTLESVLAPVRRAGSEGVIPTDRERLRLSLAVGAGGLLCGWWLGGVGWGLLLAVLAAATSSRAVAARRTRYARRLDDGAAGAALALAEALSGGRSPRSAVGAAARSLDGPIGVELERTARDLAAGARTEEALGRLRARSRSRRIDMIVAAILLQKQSGGDLATLLRDVAKAAEDQAMMRDEARAATAQARFTALTVICIGPCALGMAELAAPGTVARIAASPAGLGLLTAAGLLQALGSLAVKHVSRIDT